MVSIRAVDATLMDGKTTKGRGPRELTPAQLERQRQEKQFQRLIAQLTDETKVFEIRPAADEKATTVRQRLLRAAQAANLEVAVRKHGDGFLVGLMTEERRASQRGRKPGSRGNGANGASEG
jgi:hypothetical protein